MLKQASFKGRDNSESRGIANFVNVARSWCRALCLYNFVGFCKCGRSSRNLDAKALQYFSSRDVCNYLISAASFISFWHHLFSYALYNCNTISVTRFLRVFVGCCTKTTYPRKHPCDLDTDYGTAMNICVRDCSTNLKTGILSVFVLEPSAPCKRGNLLHIQSEVMQAYQGQLTTLVKYGLCPLWLPIRAADCKKWAVSFETGTLEMPAEKSYIAREHLRELCRFWCCRSAFSRHHLLMTCLGLVKPFCNAELDCVVVVGHA